MKLLIALASALVTSIVSTLLVLHHGANGGLLDGLEFFGLAGAGVVTGAVYYLIARRAQVGQFMLLLQSVVVAVLAPLVVLLGPLTFCIFFRPNASCM